MQTYRTTIAALAVLLLSAAPGPAQFPPGGDRGREGGGGFRGGRGSRFGGDPNAFFDRLAQGKDVLIRSELDPRMQGFFDRIAASAGITNGQITRQQFADYMQQRMNGGGGPAPQATPGGAPAAAPAPAPEGGDSREGRGMRGGFGGWSPDAMAERLFRRYDQNGDGLINYDEMSDSLRQERDKWDANRDGFIDPTEFKAFVQARVQQSMDERGLAAAELFAGFVDGAGGSSAETAPIEEDRRPTVYRIGKLPKELPAWFSQLDTDRDAQVGLYEWKQSGRPLDEFLRLDRNNDGFVTAEEVLRDVALAKAKPAEGSSNGADSRLASGAPAPGAGFGGSRGTPFGAGPGAGGDSGRSRFGGFGRGGFGGEGSRFGGGEGFSRGRFGGEGGRRFGGGDGGGRGRFGGGEGRFGGSRGRGGFGGAGQ